MIWRLGRYAIYFFYGLDVEIRPKLTLGAGTPGTVQYRSLAARPCEILPQRKPSLLTLDDYYRTQTHIFFHFVAMFRENAVSR